jgi:hypothetical protein
MNDAILFLLISSLPLMNPEAASQATQAYIKQVGVERNVNEWSERQFSPELRAKAGSVTFIAKSLIERKLVLEWRF